MLAVQNFIRYDSLYMFPLSMLVLVSDGSGTCLDILLVCLLTYSDNLMASK